MTKLKRLEKVVKALIKYSPPIKPIKIKFVDGISFSHDKKYRSFGTYTPVTLSIKIATGRSFKLVRKTLIHEWVHMEYCTRNNKYTQKHSKAFYMRLYQMMDHICA